MVGSWLLPTWFFNYIYSQAYCYYMSCSSLFFKDLFTKFDLSFFYFDFWRWKQQLSISAVVKRMEQFLSSLQVGMRYPNFTKKLKQTLYLVILASSLFFHCMVQCPRWISVKYLTDHHLTWGKYSLTLLAEKLIHCIKFIEFAMHENRLYVCWGEV